MSKPFTYALALQDAGSAAVAEKVGVEPSGDAFNEISLAAGTGQPLNPMINAGAITATSLVGGDGPEERFERILAVFSAYAGRRLAVTGTVFESETRQRASQPRDRPHAAHVRDPRGAIPTTCSTPTSANARSRSTAATSASWPRRWPTAGAIPVTGERVLSEGLVPRVLSVMTTCGMYDGSGRWVDAVGLPAKSGVAGGIFAVLPGQFGISVFSPRLDEQGNSVRGVLTCRTLARELELHSLRVARSGRATIGAAYDLSGAPSRRRRPAGEAEALRELGTRARVFELQGDVLFAGAERVARAVSEVDAEVVVLDLRGVHHVAPPAERMLGELAVATAKRGGDLVVTGGSIEGLMAFADVDAAREWAEDRLLTAAGLAPTLTHAVALADHELCRGLDSDALAVVSELLVEGYYGPGELIFAAGAPADAIFLLLEGAVDVSITLPDGRCKRFATLAPGAVFGELAVLGAAARTADVTARTEVLTAALDTDALFELEGEHPAILARLLHNMLAGAYASVARMTGEIAALSGSTAPPPPAQVPSNRPVARR